VGFCATDIPLITAMTAAIKRTLAKLFIKNNLLLFTADACAALGIARKATIAFTPRRVKVVIACDESHLEHC
jgi:hypothetical protein